MKVNLVKHLIKWTIFGIKHEMIYCEVSHTQPKECVT